MIRGDAPKMEFHARLVDEEVYNEQGNEVLLVQYPGLNAPKGGNKR
jgi:hypothetical protein